MSRLFRSGNTGPGGSPGAPLRRHRRWEAGSYACGHGRGRIASLSAPGGRRLSGAAPGGPGSLAGFQTRAAAFGVDIAAAALLAAVFTAPDLPANWSLVAFGAITVGAYVLVGQTPGMRLLGLRLAHPRPGERLALWRAVVRTALLCLLVPALLVDADGRGLHDRLTGTAVVHER